MPHLRLSLAFPLATALLACALPPIDSSDGTTSADPSSSSAHESTGEDPHETSTGAPASRGTPASACEQPIYLVRAQTCPDIGIAPFDSGMGWCLIEFMDMNEADKFFSAHPEVQHQYEQICDKVFQSSGESTCDADHKVTVDTSITAWQGELSVPNEWPALPPARPKIRIYILDAVESACGTLSACQDELKEMTPRSFHALLVLEALAASLSPAILDHVVIEFRNVLPEGHSDQPFGNPKSVLDALSSLHPDADSADGPFAVLAPIAWISSSKDVSEGLASKLRELKAPTFAADGNPSSLGLQCDDNKTASTWADISEDVENLVRVSGRRRCGDGGFGDLLERAGGSDYGGPFAMCTLSRDDCWCGTGTSLGATAGCATWIAHTLYSEAAQQAFSRSSLAEYLVDTPSGKAFDMCSAAGRSAEECSACAPDPPANKSFLKQYGNLSLCSAPDIINGEQLDSAKCEGEQLEQALPQPPVVTCGNCKVAMTTGFLYFFVEFINSDLAARKGEAPDDASNISEGNTVRVIVFFDDGEHQVYSLGDLPKAPQIYKISLPQSPKHSPQSVTLQVVRQEPNGGRNSVVYEGLLPFLGGAFDETELALPKKCVMQTTSTACHDRANVLAPWGCEGPNVGFVDQFPRPQFPWFGETHPPLRLQELQTLQRVLGLLKRRSLSWTGASLPAQVRPTAWNDSAG